MKKADRILALLAVSKEELAPLTIMDICGYWGLGGVYVDLMRLERNGVISRRVVPGGAERGYKQKYLYSLKAGRP